jgi:excisionase family DNA binding protein
MDSIEQAIIRAVEEGVRGALERHGRPVQREALRVGEVAEALGVSESEVRRLIRTGEIPSRRFGDSKVALVPLPALRRVLEEGTS